jgi:hypothetical protein
VARQDLLDYGRIQIRISVDSLLQVSMEFRLRGFYQAFETGDKDEAVGAIRMALLIYYLEERCLLVTGWILGTKRSRGQRTLKESTRPLSKSRSAPAQYLMEQIGGKDKNHALLRAAPFSYQGCSVPSHWKNFPESDLFRDSIVLTIPLADSSGLRSASVPPILVWTQPG